MKMKNIGLKLVFTLTLIVALFATTNLHTIDAKQKEIKQQVLFEETIVLSNHTSHFEVGFVRVDFKKNALPDEAYPITFEVKLYAEDGEIYIEFSPDVEEFFKDVKIHVFAFDGYIYDVSLEEFIYVEVPNFVFKVDHFSRWCFVW